MRLQFAAALLASSNESKGTITVECPLDIQISVVHTRSASSWGVGPLSLMMEVRMKCHVEDHVLCTITMDGASEKQLGFPSLLVHPNQ